MLHKRSFSKNSRNYCMHTNNRNQVKSHVRAEFQPCHPVVQPTDTHLKKKPSTQLPQPVRTIHVDITTLSYVNTLAFQIVKSLQHVLIQTAGIDSSDITSNCTSPACEFYIKIYLKYEIPNVGINDTSQRIPKVPFLTFTTMLVDSPLLLPYRTAEISHHPLLQPEQKSW